MMHNLVVSAAAVDAICIDPQSWRTCAAVGPLSSWPLLPGLSHHASGLSPSRRPPVQLRPLKGEHWGCPGRSLLNPLHVKVS